MHNFKFSKRGGIGDVVSLFFATIVIIILLFVALFGSSLIQLITQQKTGPESVILLSTDTYMDDYKSKVSGFSSQDLIYTGSHALIITRYFPDYVLEFSEGSDVEGELFEERFVKDSCSSYDDNTLTFITGVTDVVSQYNENELVLFYEQEAQDACFFVLQYLKDESPNETFYDSITEFDIEIINHDVGVLCCYGN